MTNDFWADRWADLERWGLVPRHLDRGADGWRLIRATSINAESETEVSAEACASDVAAGLLRDQLVQFLLDEGHGINGGLEQGEYEVCWRRDGEPLRPLSQGTHPDAVLYEAVKKIKEATKGRKP